MSAILTVVIAWGVLAFGAVYPWAYRPLLAIVAAIGVAGLVRAAKVDVAAMRPVVLALSAVALAAAAQLVPLPQTLLMALSPQADVLLRQFEPAYAAGLVSWHALSINPYATERGMAFLVSLGLFTSGVACLLPQAWLRQLARNVLILGSIVAVFGLVQRATFNGHIYWFWVSRFESSNAFGPFVNRNHFAGWMVMATALGAGYLCGLCAEASRPQGGWRRRLIWLSSPHSSRVLLATAAIVTMTAALVATLSRSGILALLAVVLLFAGHASRRLAGRKARSAVAIFFIAVFGLAIGWRGIDTVVDWYGRTGTLESRLALWQDTWPMLEDFAVTGTGLNTYGTATLLYPMSDRLWHAMEAHNDYLQVATEGGLLLGIPALLLLGVIVREIRRRFRVPHSPMRYWLRVGAVIGLCGIAVQEIVEFSLQMPGNAVLFAVLLAIAVHPSEPARARRAAATA